MKTIFAKTAAVLAFVIGAMAIYAGGKVLLGQDPGYYVIDWLPVYNFGIGVTSFLVSAVLIWKNSRFALHAAAATLSAHAVVLIILQIAYPDVVAPDSIRAMILRTTVWSAILILMLVQRWKDSGVRLKKRRGQGLAGR